MTSAVKPFTTTAISQQVALLYDLREKEHLMSKDDVIETEGKVIECLPNANFKVRLSNGHIITAYISGKLRLNYIRIIEGDNVKLEMSPYDLTKGRITWRSKN